MATHSSIPAWRIPGTEEPGGLQSMGSQRVRQTEATEHAKRSRQLIIFFFLLNNDFIALVQYTNLCNQGRGCG